MAQYDDLNVSRITVVGVISVVVTAVTALAVQVLFYALAESQDAIKSAASDYRRENGVLSEQAQEISAYGVDSQTARITIPIEKAMEVVIAESQKNDSSKSKTTDASLRKSDET
jgi:hypothetical protein